MEYKITQHEYNLIRAMVVKGITEYGIHLSLKIPLSIVKDAVIAVHNDDSAPLIFNSIKHKNKNEK